MHTVLVVDDDDDLRALVTMVLEDTGMRVTPAADGREALSAMRQRMPDLILLDMRMPVMDGWEFCRRLETDRIQRPPIVVITAAADAADRAAEVGAERWLSKPFDLDGLLSTVRELLPP